MSQLQSAIKTQPQLQNLQIPATSTNNKQQQEQQQHHHHHQLVTPHHQHCLQSKSNDRNDSLTSSDADRTTSSAYVYHRTREQPTPDPNDPAVVQIKFYLDRYKIKEALQIFFNEETLRLLRDDENFMWDIIPIICKRLRGLCQYRFRVYEGCDRMLCRIAFDDNCNPKEVLLSLLAELSQQNEHEDDNLFRAMIKPLEGTLLRMNHPSPRDENFRWTLDVLMRHIHNIDLPQEYNLDGKRRLSLPNDINVKRFIEVLPLMLSFIEEFNDRSNDYDKTPMPILTESQIDEVLNGELVDDDFISDHTPIHSDSIDASTTALLSLMHRPFVFLDLTNYCSDLRICANRYLNTLLKLSPNLFAPIYKRLNCLSSTSTPEEDTLLTSSYSIDCSKSTLDEPTTLLSLATCSYIFRRERFASPHSLDMIQSFPQILSHETSLACYVPYIIALVERPEVLAQEKGLLLLSSLIQQVEPNSLDLKFLDLIRSSFMIEKLFQVMVYSPLASNRRQAYHLFTCICDSLTHEGKLQLFVQILNKPGLQPCVKATCVDQYRKHLNIIYERLIGLQDTLDTLNSPELSSQYDYLTDATVACETYSQFEKLSREVYGKMPSEFYANTDNCIEPDLVNMCCDRQQGLIDDSSKVCDWWKAKTRQKMQYWKSRYEIIGGQALVDFLDTCLAACPTESQQIDIIENYELLLATLTMFRYLKLRKTSAQFFKNSIEEEYLDGKKLKKLFFDPVRNSIAMVKNELKLHHQDITNSRTKTKDVSSHPDTSKTTTVAGNNVAIPQQTDEKSNDGLDGSSGYDALSKLITMKNENSGNNSTDAAAADLSKDLSEINERDEADCLNWVLCRLDLVESVLVRTCDLFDC